MELLAQRRTPPRRPDARRSPRRARAAAVAPASHPCSRYSRLFLLVLLPGTVFFAAQMRGQAFKENDLKAAFVQHLAQFVEWPSEAFPAADTPIVIGVLGSDPFGKVLDELVQNEFVRNRKLVVERYRRVEEIKTCHILFISQSE